MFNNQELGGMKNNYTLKNLTIRSTNRPTLENCVML